MSTRPAIWSVTGVGAGDGAGIRMLLAGRLRWYNRERRRAGDGAEMWRANRIETFMHSENGLRDHPSSLAPLVDRFGRRHTYLRVSVTDRCNLRCGYCMPAEGIAVRPRKEILDFEEIARVVGLLARMGVNKVRLTGGEPTVRRGLEKLIAMLAAVPGIETVAMTTNGLTLAREADALRRTGLDALNVSLDTLRPDRFERIARRPGLEDVLRGIDAALAAGFAPLKVNMVVMGGVNDDELCDFVELARDRPIEVRFIEYMPFAGNEWEAARLVSYREMIARVRERHELIPATGPGDPNAVARDWRVPGFAGGVGFITSMTDDFCAGCNRLRLLADGSLKSCLFYPPEDNLRGAMRRGAGDGELEAIVRGVIGRKKAGHAALEKLAALPNNSMIEIGG
jgi:cyclic pyranopterin phosphate synthase